MGPKQIVHCGTRGSMKNCAWALAFATGLTLLVPQLASSAPYPSPQDWRNDNIYQIFTDRFNDGDPSNNNVEAGPRFTLCADR